MEERQPDVLWLDFNKEEDRVIFNDLFHKIKRYHVKSLRELVSVKTKKRIKHDLEVREGTELVSNSQEDGNNSK